jgi:hypothetical protein
MPPDLLPTDSTDFLNAEAQRCFFSAPLRLKKAAINPVAFDT